MLWECEKHGKLLSAKLFPQGSALHTDNQWPVRCSYTPQQWYEVNQMKPRYVFPADPSYLFNTVKLSFLCWRARSFSFVSFSIWLTLDLHLICEILILEKNIYFALSWNLLNYVFYYFVFKHKPMLVIYRATLPHIKIVYLL